MCRQIVVVLGRVHTNESLDGRTKRTAHLVDIRKASRQKYDRRRFYSPNDRSKRIKSKGAFELILGIARSVARDLRISWYSGI